MTLTRVINVAGAGVRCVAARIKYESIKEAGDYACSEEFVEVVWRGERAERSEP